MGDFENASSFEKNEAGKVRVTSAALPKAELPDFREPLRAIEGLQTTLTMAVGRWMRLSMRSELVEGGTVLFGPSDEEGVTDVYLTADDSIEDSFEWVSDRQAYDQNLGILLNWYPVKENERPWQDVIESLAAEATAAGLSLDWPPPPPPIG